MKNVFIPAGDRGLGPRLLEQLRIYGITVREVDGVAEVARLTEAIGSGILIVDSDRIDRDPLFISGVIELKERLGKGLRVIYYASRDDFASRLRAVRAGAEAFFELPVDAWRLAERIDSLFGESESEPYRVLVIDDDQVQVDLNREILERAGMSVFATTDPEMVIPLIVERKPDILLLDMYMPSCTGPEIAGVIRQNEAFASIPIVFLSVERDLEKQISAIRRGGDEFLEKPVKPEHLVNSVLVRAERTRSIRHFTERDSLTGLLNQGTLAERLANELLRARRAGAVVSFAKVDIDGFKGINSGYGHLTGDRVLRSLSRLLSDRLRRTDIVGRCGGEEFGVILPGTDGKSAARLVDELRESFAKLEHNFGEKVFSLTFSAGISSYPDFVGPGDVVEAADRALRRAKEGGKDRVAIESSRG
jgi:diguanylate cyclase (GGDEF)-like protein